MIESLNTENKLSEMKHLISLWNSFAKKYFLHSRQNLISFRSPDDLCAEMDFSMDYESDIELNDELLKILEQVANFSPWSQHPNLMGYLYSTPDLIGIIGDWIVSAVNTNVHTYLASPVFSTAEYVLCKELLKIVGFDDNADGIFCPGGSYSNMLAIFMAKKRAVSLGAEDKKLVAFTSAQAHYSIDKAAYLVGVAQKNIRKISCDEFGRMNIGNLAAELQKAKDVLEYPFIVCATAGTTVLGAIDQIDDISKLLKNYKNIWLHVDCAWGGAILLSGQHRNKLKGIEKVDTLTWDFHKALGAPILCSALLSRDNACLRNMFEVTDDYLFHNEFVDEELELGRKTLQCGRRGDAFKLWLMFKTRGFKYYEKLIDQNFEKATYFVNKLKEFDDIWLHNEKFDSWNICFWYIPKTFKKRKRIESCSESEKTIIDSITKQIFQYFTKQGTVQLNYAELEGRPAFLRLLVAGSNVSFDAIDYVIYAIRSIGFILSGNLEELLTSGGDERLWTNDDGYNKNFASPVPKPFQIARSSCTCSTIKQCEFDRLEKLLKKLKDGEISFESVAEVVHDRIRNILKADRNLSVITVPSGTDAEYIALLTAKAYFGLNRNLLNIVTGEGEIGSNSALAAGGKHFAIKTPEGVPIENKKTLSNIGKVAICKVYLRDPITGKPLDQSDIWIKKIEKKIESTNDCILLHILESSKLGYRMDRMGEIEDIISHYEKRLLVVVDACQSRTDIRRIRQYLRLGCMVMITGSKFEQSPPFSGAVLIPSQISDQLSKKSLSDFPFSLKHFISTYDVSGPISKVYSNHLNNWMNIGLMLRWTIGLDNWEQYRQIDEKNRNLCIKNWVHRIISEIEKYERIKLFGGGEYQFGSVGNINTIISFQLFINGKPIDIETASKVYKYMATDISDIFSEKIESMGKMNEILSKSFVLGQPVNLGDFAVLRIALGARLVNRLSHGNFEEEFKNDIELLKKLDVILHYLEEIEEDVCR